MKVRRVLASVISAAVVVALDAGAVHAAVFTVGAGGTHATIQSAIDAAVDAPGDDEVRVQAGRYPERLEVVAATGSLRLVGGWDAAFAVRGVGPSVVDGEAGGRPLTVDATGDARVSVEALTLTGGDAVDAGGGVHFRLSDVAQAELVRCVVEGNSVTSGPLHLPAHGGGIDAYIDGASSLRIATTRVRENRAFAAGDQTAFGGGLSVIGANGSRVELIGNEIVGNSAVGTDNQATAGGVYVAFYLGAGGSITGNLVRENVASSTGASGLGSGGAVWVLGSGRVELRRNRWLDGIAVPATGSQLSLIADDGAMLAWSDEIVAGGTGVGVRLDSRSGSQLLATNVTVADHPSAGIAVAHGDGFTSLGGRLALFNSIAFGNSPNAELLPWVEAGGNLTAGTDPRFVDAAAGDYRLLPGSPAIDLGHGAPPGGLQPIDIEGLARVSGAAVDAGAHEAQSGLCRVDRFGEVTGLPAFAPACSCLRDEVLRSFRCGFWTPDLFFEARIPLPLLPGWETEVDWTIHPWLAGDAPYQLDAELSLDAETVIPVAGKGKLAGQLKAGKDVEHRLRLELPFEPAVLRVRLQHLPEGAKQPSKTVAEILIGPSSPPNEP